ncbi:NAD-dependent epimerase/dehydratase family protein [Aquirufa sp. 2-AUSEE-184A6]|jgi:nucleoside-diphosphate-sugar epimerase|uniref:NAD-dependent epimerase/dehydratase family protein n=1 Tax=Aquirufa novilacunae TaxID=3139305 RepID=A0ABW8SYN8_9BACT
MNNRAVLITGISGFLGSQIARQLLLDGYKVFATRRKKTDLARCQDFKSDISWIDLEDGDWQNKIIKLMPDIIIHSAWLGVSANDRDNWSVQFSNVEFVLNLLSIAKSCKVEKFIAFGSQAEYGVFSGVIDEKYPTNPSSSYASAKVAVSQIINNYSTLNGLNWYWFRLFSFFGEQEDSNWLIPTLIERINNLERMDMTPGEQKYAYMYVGDLAKIISKIVGSNLESGIYNISSSSAISLVELTQKILNIIKPKNSQINFGAIPYRANQSMLIQGSNKKLELALGIEIQETYFEESLTSVIKYKLNEN